MSGFLLDTNVPSELTRPAPDANVEAWLAAAPRPATYISVVTLGEIRKGFTILGNTNRRRQLEEWFAKDIDLWFEERIPPVTRAIAERWGVIDGMRQLTGQPLNTADGLIAATALEHNLSLVTRNVRDYDGPCGPYFRIFARALLMVSDSAMRNRRTAARTTTD